MNRFSSLRRHLTAALAALVLVVAQLRRRSLRFTCTTTATKAGVLRDLLDRFEADNPDIRVIIDTVPYDSGILQSLPLQLATDAGPDIARVTDLVAWLSTSLICVPTSKIPRTGRRTSARSSTGCVTKAPTPSPVT